MDRSAYNAQKRRIEQMRNQLIRHGKHSTDPDCPDFTWEDVDEMERELWDAAED